MALQDFVNKEGYIATVAGLGATLAGQATDPSTERELPWLTQTQIALEITVAFNALADGGLRVRILEYMTSGSAATVATPGNEGTIPLDAGATVRQTFLFTVRSRYYIIELFNLDSAAGRDAGSIAVQVIETPESEESADGQVNTHTQYYDGDAWQPQLIMAWETGGNLDRITAAVEIMDDWDESDRAKVNIIVGQAGITADAGAVAANTPRVTLASDDPAVVALEIIDDWDESDRAKVNIIVGQAGITADAGAVAANTPRMTLASDDPAVTALQIIDDWDESDRAMVNIIVGQAGVSANTGAMDATTQRVTLATNDPAVVALQLLDDAIKTDDAAFTPATDKVSMIGAEFDDAAPDSVDEGDAGAIRMSAFRSLHTLIRDAAGNERGANVTAANELNVLESNSGAIETAVEIMDDWDESDRAKVNLIVGQAGITADAGAVAANTPRMTLASDDPAVTALQIIDDWDESDRAKVNPIAGQAGVQAGAGAVSALTQRVILATDDPAVVALQLLDDAIKTDDAAFTPATDKVAMIGAEFDDAAPDSVDEGDAGAVRMSAFRSLHTLIRDAAGNERGANVTAANELNVLESNSGAIETAVEIMDDWDESDRAKVNIIVGQAGITADAGAVAANTPRVTLANDDPAVVALQLLDDAIKTDDAAFTPATDKVAMIGAEFDDAAPDSVDEGDAGAVRMSAFRSLHTLIRDAAGNERGANVTAANELNVLESNSGAIQTALEIIDDWDETDRAKVNIIVGQAGITADAGAVAANTPRITLASDDPAVTALEIIDDWDETNRAKVNPIVGQAGVQGNTGTITALTQRVTVATNDTVATDLTAIKTAVEIIDDWDETNRAAVNLIAGQVGVQGNEGVITALTQRVTLATDDDAVASLGIIDDWDETNRAAVNLIAGQVGVQGGAGAVSALTQRVILATDDPAVTALEKIDGMSTLGDAVETALTQVIKTVAAIAVPEAIAGAGTVFRRATIYAAKAARTANAGIIYLGVTAGNDTQPIPLNPGDIFTIEAPPGEKYDFDNWYVDVLNAGDGVIVIYS